MDNAEVSLEKVAGRTLRVARWRLDAPGDHPPILFFNGIGANIEAVAPLADALDDRAMIIFDMPGAGGSPDPVVPYNPFTMSWTASRLLRRLGIDHVDVMGVSWGGGMAQHFALQHGGLVRRLVLCATSPGMLMVPGSPAALTKMVNPRRYIDAAFMERHFQALYGGNQADNAKDGHISRLRPPTTRGYLYQLLAMAGWTSLPALPFLSKPTMIMMGEDDQVVPVVNGRIMNRLIPHSELMVMEGGGHLFLVTHADQSVSAIRGFLDSPARPAGRPARDGA
ncbi:MAG: alpha/beta fold hydrolase [Sphingomonadales bacterium]|nr:alpha/beta fold hydrolase [Sphingomonadales bacterium]MDE2569755.1 alpha/beta fold hydrolase [Sphingomonadales bacterium]